MKTRDHLPCRAVLFLLLAVVCPILLTQCKTSGGSYEKIEYDPATLKTPSGHGLEKKDYPFDDEGNYRKDWVKNKSTGKVRSASKHADNALAASPTTDPGATSSAGTAPASYPGYAGPATSTAAPPAPPAPSVAPTPASVSPRYHKVASGDTLFSLARKYGTSVSELKQVNGLTGDGIRTGQQLRLP